MNGAFYVSQELGTGGRTTDGYICDGWRIDHAGSSVQTTGAVSAGVNTPGLAFVLAATTTTAQTSMGAGDYVFIAHQIEGYRIARLGWGTANAQPITIAFKTWHTRPGTYSVGVRNYTGTRSYFTTYTQNVSTAIEYKTVTIPGDVTGTWEISNLRGIQLIFTQACGTTFTIPSVNTWAAGNFLSAPGQVNAVAATSDVFRLTGVVVLPGTQAPTAAQSPLIMRPYDQELVTCKRYYYNASGSYGGLASTPKIASSVYYFPVEMRAAPTITGTFAANTGNAGTFAANSGTQKNCVIYNSLGNWTIEAIITYPTLYFDARL